MKLKVYVASSSKEMERAKRAIGILAKDKNVKITLDWTREIEKQGSANAGLSFEVKRAAAYADLRAVHEADVFLLLAPQDASRGAYTELGAALALGKMVFIAGREGTVLAGSIFHSLAQAVFETTHLSFGCDDRAVEHIRQLAKIEKRQSGVEHDV